MGPLNDPRKEETLSTVISGPEIIEVISSSEDEDDEHQELDAYQLLPQDAPPEGASSLLDRLRYSPTYDERIQENPRLREPSTSNEDIEERPKAEVEKPRPIELTDQKIEEIKNAMASFKLPTNRTLTRAEGISDEQWEAMLKGIHEKSLKKS